MSIFFCCVLQKVSGEDYDNIEIHKKQEDRSELCSTLCWFKGSYCNWNRNKSELDSDLYQEKEVLNQNHFYAAATDSLVIVLGNKAKPSPQPEQTRLSFASNSKNLHTEHTISKSSLKQ